MKTQVTPSQRKSTSRNSRQLKTTQDNLSQLKSTKVNESQLASTQVNSRQLASTQIGPSNSIRTCVYDGTEFKLLISYSLNLRYCEL